jgi:hypothetical protein
MLSFAEWQKIPKEISGNFNDKKTGDFIRPLFIFKLFFQTFYSRLQLINLCLLSSDLCLLLFDRFN